MAKFFDRDKWLISQLRRLSVKFPPRLNVLNRAKTTYYITSKKGTQVKRVSFQCELCGTKGLNSKEVQLDHTIPVVGVKGYTNLWDFIDRLFCEESNFRCICVPCHSNKSLYEQDQRHFNKKVIKSKKRFDTFKKKR